MLNAKKDKLQSRKEKLLSYCLCALAWQAGQQSRAAIF